MRDWSLGAHALELRVQVGLDACRRPLVTPNPDLQGRIAPAADQDLTGCELPPVAVAEMGVGGEVAEARSVRRAAEHLSATRLDCHLRKPERGVSIRGEDHAAGTAFGSARPH